MNVPNRLLFALSDLLLVNGLELFFFFLIKSLTR